MKDLNFFEGIKKQEGKQTLGNFMRNGLIVLVVCAVLVGGVFGGLFWQKSTAQAEVEALNSQMETMKAASADYMLLEQNQIKLEALKTYNTIIETFTKNLSIYPHVDRALMDDIRSKMPADVSILKVSYANNVFKMDCSANDTSAPADFVRNLRESKRIADVGYNGYNAAEGAVPPDAAGAVTFSVSCTLAEGGDTA